MSHATPEPPRQRLEARPRAAAALTPPHATPEPPRQRLEVLLHNALADPLAELRLLPLNRPEWQRIHRLYRPLLDDLLQRAQRARSVEEIEALGRIASGLLEERQSELNELRRSLDPPSRYEPNGPDSASSGIEVSQRLVFRLCVTEIEAHPFQVQPEWQPVTFVGLAQLRPSLTELTDLFSESAGQVALVAQLGFSFVDTHTSPHQLAQRLFLVALLNGLGFSDPLSSPIPVRYRPSWDVWAPQGGIVGSVQSDLRLSSLAPFGPNVLWSQIVRADDGLGYLVVFAPVQPAYQHDWLSTAALSERRRRQRTLSAAMLPRPGHGLITRARAAVDGLRSAFERALSDAHYPRLLPLDLPRG